MKIGPYLYQGTTEGWPGNSVLQDERISCTSTDPLVATLFAIGCRNHGRAIVAAAKLEDFAGLIASSNHFFLIESAVNLCISPLQFASMAEVILEVDTALAILSEIGFTDLPGRIRDKESLRDAILHTYEAGQCSSQEQCEAFNIRMLEVRS